MGAKVYGQLEADRRTDALGGRGGHRRRWQASMAVTVTGTGSEDRTEVALRRDPAPAGRFRPGQHRIVATPERPDMLCVPVLKEVRRASEAPSAGRVPAGDEGDTGRGQGDLDDELDPVDPAGAAHPKALAMKVPMRAATMPIRISQPDGDGLAAGQDQPTQRPDDQADDDGADDAGNSLVGSLSLG